MSEAAQATQPTGAVPLDVSVVLPCFNEGQHVRAEVDRICAALDGSGLTYELLAYDDGSTDDTADQLRAAMPTHPALRVTVFRRNGGAGTTRRIGTEESRGRIVAWTDADLTYPNERIPELVRLLDDDPTYDQVVGAREREAGTFRLLRVPAKWFVRKVAERLTGERIPDLNSGLRVFRREVALPYLRLMPPGFSCVTTLTLAFLADQHDIRYVPITYVRRSGQSKFHFIRDAYRYLLQVLRMVMYFNPLKLLMPPGLVIFGIGVAKVVYDNIRNPFYVTTNAVLLLVTGLLVVSLALLADLIVRSRAVG